MEYLQKLGEKVEEGIEGVFHGGHKQEEDQPVEQQSSGDGEGKAGYKDWSGKVVNNSHRFGSFAPKNSGHVKWHVDGASYFYAVSVALEEAQESIYILDWWLSPELYLRRPPSRNEQYRLDNMLKAAAERGVQVNVIVYKEVAQALSCDSEHTKHALEALHPNIKCFRHPDHVYNANDIKADIENSFSNMRLNAFSLSKVGGDTVKALYGSSDDMVLYWAHHEKLCIVDRKLVFMGGLDLCFGRWDTNTHPIADAHPANVDAIIYPGQDYNNARIYDFENVGEWDQNKLDRTKHSRMGWSDISMSVQGPIVHNLIDHFSDRWNYILSQKYATKNPDTYEEVAPSGGHLSNMEDHAREEGGRVQHGMRRFHDGFRQGHEEGQAQHEGSGMSIQLCRSCTGWSAGKETEHSIQNAYIEVIKNAKYFVYMENQFFITATDPENQKPVENLVGKALVDRIVRAHEAGEPFRVIVNIPAVPAFAGDLQSDGALGTRAIMEYQYKSISRGGYSIMEQLQKAGIDDPRRYITFYNLRNYDRINNSDARGRAEEESGVQYEEARREFDDMVGADRDAEGYGREGDEYQRYQRAAEHSNDTTKDTIAAAYMESGVDLRDLPWEGSPEAEMNAFVSEELYIHTKVLIADDRVVICGSANLNDRSQVGSHDSEIAIVIEDHDQVESTMNGEPFRVARFAASLRRQLFRKHLGLLPHQAPDRPDANWMPINHDGQQYDWGSESDRLVEDPLSDDFWELWSGTARTNTDAFNKVFHPVPSDLVRTWDQYDNFFTKHFIMPGEEPKEDEDNEGKVEYGHVVPGEFPDGVDEVKKWLGKIRGTLVNMPLEFLIEVEDMAKMGLSFNSFTEEIYT